MSMPVRFMTRIGMQLRSQQKRALSAAPADATALVEQAARTPAAKKPKSRRAAVVAVASKPLKSQAATARVATATAGSDDGSRILHEYPTLVPARLLRRYKRFLADVVLLEADEDNVTEESDEDMQDRVVTIYCPNTGPMVGLLDEPNARVQLSRSDDPKRKYAYTLEMVRIHNGERHVWVGVHSASANYMVERALNARWFTELSAFDVLQREVKFAKGSRVDFVLSTLDVDGDVAHQTYVEVKSVTLALDADCEPEIGEAMSSRGRCAVFPDTVSTRAQKHVSELIELIEARRKSNRDSKGKKQSHVLSSPEQQQQEKPAKRVELRGALIFLVQRDDCNAFMPSLRHDAAFARLCAQAEARGVQLIAYACRLEPQETQRRGCVHLLPAPLPLHAARVAEKSLKSDH